MNFFSQHLRRSRFVFRNSALTVAALALAAQLAPAQGTHLWTQSRLDEFEKGTPQGVALTSDGHLTEGPGLIESEPLPRPTSGQWLRTRDGLAYVGTASPATVLRIGADGKPFTLFESKDVAVQVVRLGPDGALYAATLPSGKVYKLNPGAIDKQDENSATAVFDAAAFDEAVIPRDERRDKRDQCITFGRWLLTRPGGCTLPPAGRVRFIAWIEQAGRKARSIFQERRGAYPFAGMGCEGQPDRRFGWQRPGLSHQSRRQGLRALRGATAGDTSLAVAENGTIYAASVGDKSRNPLPPLPVQGAAAITMMIVQPGSMQAANTSASVPEGSEIYALDRRPGATQTVVRQGRDRLCTGGASRGGAGADRQSRARLPHRR